MNMKYDPTSRGNFWFALIIFLTAGHFFPEAPLAQAKNERVAILKSANIAPYNQAIEAFKINLRTRLEAKG